MSEAVERLIVVLGYSDGGRGVLHPVCADRLSRAAELATEDDVVLLSGWARVAGTRPEAELMADAWAGRARELIVDRDARTTVANATNAVVEARRIGARHVVVVTSRWHAPRAAVVFRWRLRRSEATVATAATQGGGVRDWLREVPSWAILPFQLAMGRAPLSSLPGRRGASS